MKNLFRAFPLAALLVLLVAVSPAVAATTIGSLPSSTTTGACDHCTGLQGSDSAAGLYTAPVSGVITSFSVRSGTVLTAADRYRLALFTQASAPNWTIAGLSEWKNWPGLTSAFADKTITWTTQMPVMQGDHLGLDLDDAGAGNTSYFFATASALDNLVGGIFPTFDVGYTSTGVTSWTNERMNVRAQIEPDADHDGYGDETQDGCPTDRADQGPCTAPAISAFKFSLNKFRVNTHGRVLSASSTGKGTTIIVTLSKAAHVTFVLNLKGTGRKVGGVCVKPTRKNRAKKKCTYYPHQYSFVRDLPAGTSNLGFSGRIKVGSKTRTLPAGSYVATASPFSIQSQLAGAPAKATFKVVPRARR